jgi:uncharacterized protein YqhQ
LNWKTFLRWAAHAQLLPVLENGEEILVGGQAVMEGVMMRAPHSYCVAVRRPDGSYATEEARLEKLSDKYPVFKYPIIRGVGTLVYSMWLGLKALRFSANVVIDAELAREAAEKGEAMPVAGEKKPSGEMPQWLMIAQIVFSLGFFILMYKFLPLLIATGLQKAFPVLNGWIILNVLDGIVRLLIFLGFLWLLSLSKDIHRVFEYHGAEHRVVFNFESGKPLTVANAQSFTTWHPRCGTSFLLVVMLVSIAVYALVPTSTFLARFLTRVAALPLIMGISYEIIRFAAKNRGSLLTWITAPGLWLQRITTQPPSDDQTEVAIRALDGAMEIEKQVGGELVIA